MEKGAGRRSRGRIQTVFRFAGSLTGNTMVVARKAAGMGELCGKKGETLCKRIVSGAGVTCARVVRQIPGTTRRTPPPNGQAVRMPARAATSHALTDIARGTVGQGPAAAARPQPKPFSPSPPSAETKPTEEADSTPPAKKRAVRGSIVPRTPPVREVSSDEVEKADFGGAAEKLFFRRALSDLSHPDTAVRGRTARALRGIRHPLSVRALGAQLAHEVSPAVRKECVNALAALEIKSGFPIVVRSLEDADTSVRLASVRAVYRLGGSGGAAALVRMLSDESAEVRRMAAACLGWLEDPELAMELAPLLQDASGPVRRTALEALGNLGAAELAPSVAERLTDADESVRRKAFAVLGQITGRDMGAAYPDNEEERQRLAARWRHWLREETQ